MTATRTADELRVRTYSAADCVVFRKTAAAFGGLSNMAPGYPLQINGVRIRTSEALYQACRFPHDPELQRLIIEQRSPMAAKMMTKPHLKKTRTDWDEVRVPIMRWCLRVKLAQNWAKFGELLDGTGDRPIVEESRRDDFWGAKVKGEGTLVGRNVLGQLLMELRDQLRAQDRAQLRRVDPPAVPNFLLYGHPIGIIEAADSAPDAVGLFHEFQVGGRILATSGFSTAEADPGDLTTGDLEDDARLAGGDELVSTGARQCSLRTDVLLPVARVQGIDLQKREGRVIATRGDTVRLQAASERAASLPGEAVAGGVAGVAGRLDGGPPKVSQQELFPEMRTAGTREVRGPRRRRPRK